MHYLKNWRCTLVSKLPAPALIQAPKLILRWTCLCLMSLEYKQYSLQEYCSLRPIPEQHHKRFSPAQWFLPHHPVQALKGTSRGGKKKSCFKNHLPLLHLKKINLITPISILPGISLLFTHISPTQI